MKKELIKILFLIALPLLLSQGCNLDSDITNDPITPKDTSTGMWYVGGINTGGDVRYVKGFIVNQTQYALLADGNKGLTTVNISNAGSPTLTANYNTGGFAEEIYIDTVRGNTYAFLSDNTKGLFVFNVSTPASPILISNLYSGAGAASVNRKDNYLFVALNSGNIKILNLNTLPDSVFENGSFTTSNQVDHIEVQNNTAYFVEKIIGLEIVDIANPLLPVLLSTYKSPGSCYDIKIAAGLAYIADGNNGITTISVSNPAQPYFIKTTNTDSDVRGLDYSPNFLFSADYNSGTEVFNLFNTTSPEMFGYYEPAGYCYNLNYFKGKVLAANGTKGLLILRF
jgi:hypothetical protein